MLRRHLVVNKVIPSFTFQFNSWCCPDLHRYIDGIKIYLNIINIQLAYTHNMNRTEVVSLRTSSRLVIDCSVFIVLCCRKVRPSASCVNAANADCRCKYI